MAVPAEVIAVYGLDPATVQRVDEGMVNYNFRAEAGGERYFLQRLSPIFGERVNLDFETTAKHLAAEGWEVPQLVETQQGQGWRTDDAGYIWRLQTFLPSSGTPSELDVPAIERMSALLARFHQSMATLDYTPQFVLPHFHDTVHYRDKLVQRIERLPYEAGRLAFKLLANDLPTLPETTVQLIHGDPRAENMLFRDGNPFTFIDFDTVMLASRYLDIGDFLRSIAEELHRRGTPMTRPVFERICEAYRQVAEPDTEPETFVAQAHAATRRIAGELTMRYLVDMIDDNYFTWDEKKFQSRRDHNWNRAQEQWDIINELDAIGARA